ncbi:hypothetical protein GCM10010916_47990 [Paenibacillus abyssi]|uniref:Uncharacterized protein n=1 Tax=Paenibacillus abyssi TaxID=1340531 RepID=A0A917LIB4_9BACL|nr:hypothetical protein GCM10010916_47990 [Paenibacillus abyssi]
MVYSLVKGTSHFSLAVCIEFIGCIPVTFLAVKRGVFFVLLGHKAGDLLMPGSINTDKRGIERKLAFKLG